MWFSAKENFTGFLQGGFTYKILLWSLIVSTALFVATFISYREPTTNYAIIVPEFPQQPTPSGDTQANGTVPVAATSSATKLEMDLPTTGVPPKDEETYPYEVLSRKPPGRLLNDMPEEARTEVELNSTEQEKLKKLLYWNEAYGAKDFGMGFGRAPFLAGECRYNNCFATGQRDRFAPDEIDAVLWHYRSNDQSLPEIRYPHAQYIFFIAESPAGFVQNIALFNGLFDLTFTYRRDSDIPAPYDIIAKKDSMDEVYSKGDFSKGKTKIAAWFVSNCLYNPSGRNRLVETLKNYTEVDVYGSCGTFKCPRDTTEDCYKTVAKNYFFYLSLENSLCRDYITEKFFNILMYDIVPVVYGYGPYWKHAPPHSYIDIFDFTSVEELAKYLIHLSKTPYEYNEYFRWKIYYFVLPQYTRRVNSLCRICELLNTKTPSQTSRYDLKDWFVDQSDCKASNLPDISDFISGKKLNLSYNELRDTSRQD